MVVGPFYLDDLDGSLPNMAPPSGLRLSDAWRLSEQE
jgi:hypothetical protein